MHSFSSYTNRVELGRGGMSTVYRATAPDGGTVALKALAIHLAADPTALRRFEVEIKLLSDLVHPHIVRLLDANLRGSPPFMVTEYVEGDSLDKIVLREGALPARRLASILIDIGYALDYAHARGIIHRDVKPGNILVRRSNGRALLADFGVAKSTELTAFTSTNARVGSVYYMSPEQIEGRLEITRVSDVYSLGVTAYLALTGKHPYEGGSEITIAKQHLDTQPRHPSDLNALVPRAVGDVVMRAIAKRTYERFATAGEFARRVRDAVGIVYASSSADAAAAPAVVATPAAEPRVREPVTPLPQSRVTAHTADRQIDMPPRPVRATRATPAPRPAPAPQVPAERAPSRVLLPLTTVLVVSLLCAGIALMGGSLLAGIGLPGPFGARTVLPRIAGETNITPLPTPILLDQETMLPTPTSSLRTIATDIAARAQLEPGGIPTLVGTLQPEEPIVVYQIVTATPQSADVPAPAAPAPMVSVATATPRPRPLPRPANPVYPAPPAPQGEARTPPPPPTPPSRNPLKSPLAIITAAP
jgi:eukaryotic-like serine/threonine-protein kinase